MKDGLPPPLNQQHLTAQSAIDAIRATPRSRLSHELQLLSENSPLPRWTRSMAAGDAELLEDLGDALTAYHRVAIEPHSDAIEAVMEADRAHRSRMMLDRGVEGLLLSARPLMQWRPPVLEVRYDFDRDLHLGGRGLRLVPSYFCQRVPMALADPDLPPILVYPVNHDYAWKYDLAARSSSDRAWGSSSTAQSVFNNGTSGRGVSYYTGANFSGQRAGCTAKGQKGNFVGNQGNGYFLQSHKWDC